MIVDASIFVFALLDNWGLPVVARAVSNLGTVGSKPNSSLLPRLLFGVGQGPLDLSQTTQLAGLTMSRPPPT